MKKQWTSFPFMILVYINRHNTFLGWTSLKVTKPGFYAYVYSKIFLQYIVQWPVEVAASDMWWTFLADFIMNRTINPTLMSLASNMNYANLLIQLTVKTIFYPVRSLLAKFHSWTIVFGNWPAVDVWFNWIIFSSFVFLLQVKCKCRRRWLGSQWSECKLCCSLFRLI